MKRREPVFYRERKVIQLGKRKKLSRRINVFSFLRLLTFSAGAVSVFFLAEEGVGLATGAFVVFLIPFLYFVKKFELLKDERDHIDQLIAINENEEIACNGDFSIFPGGQEFIDQDHPFSYDLDLFGEGSIFQFLNRSATLSGKMGLAQRLKYPFLNKEDIELHQEAIKELAPKVQWRQDFLASGMRAKESDREREAILEWTKSRMYFAGNRFFPFAIVAFPVPATIAFGLWLSGLISFPVFFVFFMLNLGVTGLYLKKINLLHAELSLGFKLIKKYGSLLVLIEKDKFTSSLMKKYQGNLVKDNVSAGKATGKLASILNSLDNRANIVAALFGNGLFLRDIRSAYNLEKWKINYGEKLGEWIETLMEVDSICSFANYSFNHPDFAFGEISNGDTLVHSSAAGHPLISGENRVMNPIDINKWGTFIILTGANMAGKSTYLRTVATNLLLARCGAPVCATDFIFQPVELQTSMRTKDSLKDQESFFYAELKKLENIIIRLEKGDKLLIFLDEILKGTNSVDQHKGSLAFMKKVIRLKGAGIIATHDLGLGILESEYPEQVRNHCFEVQITGDKLEFDYQIKSGTAKNLNATYLMRKMGITDRTE